MTEKLLTLLRDVQTELRHCRVFVSTREKIAAVGLELYDELAARVDAALVDGERYVLPRDALLKAVDDEPELPGAMPPEMWSALLAALMKGEQDTVEEMVRIAVRQTKQGIRDRIAACISNTR